MTTSADLRIGDAERDAAIELLGRHFVDGRLTQLEHSERTEAALRARRQSDLDALLADLPDLDRPARAAVPAHRHGPAPWPWPLPLVLLAFLVLGGAAHGVPVLPFLVLAVVLARLARRGPWSGARGAARRPHWR